MSSSSERAAGQSFLKGSNATSGTETAAPHPTDPSSGKLRRTPTSADEFALSGPSNPPDPAFNAYRNDLADIALAGKVVASHYAIPLQKKLRVAAILHSGPSSSSEVIRELAAGERFGMLDDSLNWAWGYAGEDRRVGYVGSDALAF